MGPQPHLVATLKTPVAPFKGESEGVYMKAMKKTKILELVLKVIVAAITAALTAITTTSCMGFGPL